MTLELVLAAGALALALASAWGRHGRRERDRVFGEVLRHLRDLGLHHRAALDDPAPLVPRERGSARRHREELGRLIDREFFFLPPPVGLALERLDRELAALDAAQPTSPCGDGLARDLDPDREDVLRAGHRAVLERVDSCARVAFRCAGLAGGRRGRLRPPVDST